MQPHAPRRTIVLCSDPAFGPLSTGGVHVEAISCCFKGLSAQQLSPLCLREAEWVQAEIDKHFELTCQDRLRRREYFQAASACLEDPEVAAVLQRLAANPKVRGVRQVLNVDPDWPRNGTNGLGELLDLPAWRAGYAQLAGVGFSFDMQLNPHQFQKGAALAASHPAVPVIINHMGTPRLQDLQDGGGLFWEGMEALAAAGPHVFLQVSMLGCADRPTVADIHLRLCSTPCGDPFIHIHMLMCMCMCMYVHVHVHVHVHGSNKVRRPQVGRERARHRGGCARHPALRARAMLLRLQLPGGPAARPRRMDARAVVPSLPQGGTGRGVRWRRNPLHVQPKRARSVPCLREAAREGTVARGGFSL